MNKDEDEEKLDLSLPEKDDEDEENERIFSWYILLKSSSHSKDFVGYLFWCLINKENEEKIEKVCLKQYLSWFLCNIWKKILSYNILVVQFFAYNADEETWCLMLQKTIFRVVWNDVHFTANLRSWCRRRRDRDFHGRDSILLICFCLRMSQDVRLEVRRLSKLLRTAVEGTDVGSITCFCFREDTNTN